MQARVLKHNTLTLPSALIVDGDDGTRLMYRTAFESMVESILEAEDGVDALVVALRERPALVIMETRLARLDGVALCALLRADPATRSAKIVVVTSAPSGADATRALAAGADVVMVKPCDLDGLIGEVRELWEEKDATPSPTAADRATRLEAATVSGEPAARARIRSRSYQRHWTTTPLNEPPSLLCPSCDGPLVYVNSHIGGVSEKLPEQWDYLTCERCGTFCYRHRTRKLTAVR